MVNIFSTVSTKKDTGAEIKKALLYYWTAFELSEVSFPEKEATNKSVINLPKFSKVALSMVLDYEAD